MVRVHEPDAGRDDAMPVGVRVVAEGDIKPVFEADQARHGIGRRAIHADLAVLVDSHEGKGGIDPRVDHLEVQPVHLGDRLPEADAGAAHGIDADLESGAHDGGDVDDVAQVRHVRGDVVVQVRGFRLHGAGQGHALDVMRALCHDRVGAFLYGLGGGRVGGSAAGWVVLEAAVARGIVRGRDDNAVGQPAGPAPVVGEDGVRDDRRRRVTEALLDHDLLLVAGEHLDGARQRRLGQGVRIHADVERARDTLRLAVLADGLRDGQDVVLRETASQGRAAVPGCAESDLLGWVSHVGLCGIVGRDEPRYIDQHLIGSRFARQRMKTHG